MAGFPNFHIVGGTAQGTTAFNFTHTLAMQAEHATALIARCLAEGIRTMEVTSQAENRWETTLAQKHVDHQHFYEECTPDSSTMKATTRIVRPSLERPMAEVHSNTSK